MRKKNRFLYLAGSAVLLALTAAIPARADYQSTVLSQSPAGYWQLNEPLSPVSTYVTNSGSLLSAADGSYSNLPTLGAPGPFVGSLSVGLDGSSQFINTPYSANLNTSSFSFEIWAKPAVGASASVLYLASSVNTASPRSGWYLAQDTSTGATFGLGNSFVVRMFNTNAATQSITLSAFVPPAGTWMHIVLTYDGTTATLYTNGVVASSGIPTANGAGLRYVPNVNSKFSVGCRSDGTPPASGFPWPGNVAEAAMYPSALSASRVVAHYTAATTTPASYASTVLADAPLLYDRYQAQPYTVTPNLGTLGSGAKGLYVAPMTAGVTGPTPPSEPGFASTNVAASFSSGGGAVKLPAFNFNTNTVTITGWINASATQTKSAGIVVCDGGGTVAGLNIDNNNAGPYLGYIWNNDSLTYGTSLTFDLNLPALNPSEWTYVALVIQPTEANIYIASPTTPFTGVTNPIAHVNQSFSSPTLIGLDSAVANFNGGIDEVGIWNRSLTSGEIYSQYASAVGGLAPIIFNDPTNSITITSGDTLTLSVNAGGTPNLSYQWRSNSVAITSATNSVFNKPSFDIVADVGNYDVIVTNNYGAVTSAVAVVTGVLATAPVIFSGPVGGIIYPGGVLNLSVVATGGGLTYQWKHAGTNLPGATTSTYIVPSVTTNNGGSYVVTVTNTLGTTNLGPAIITVPVLAAGTYAAVIDADAPEAWWRLDETSVTNGAPLLDAFNRHNGAYTNAGGLTIGNAGAIVGGVAGTAAKFTGDTSYGIIPFFPAMGGPNVSIELWAKQNTAANNLVVASSYDGVANAGFALGTSTYWQGYSGNGSGVGTLGSAAGTTAGYDPTINAGQWVHLVITYGGTGNAGFPYQIFVNGHSDGFIWGFNSGNNPANAGKPFVIGGLGTGLASILSRNFIGYVDEVAFYKTNLSAAQVLAHYNAAYFGVPPSFTVQPKSQNAFVGDTVTLAASVSGTAPISLQWKKNGISLTTQTNTSITLSNVAYSTSVDVYTLFATNSSGNATSSNAVVTVYPVPTFVYLTNGLVLHMPFDGSYSDTSGRNNNGTAVGSPSFVAGKIGSGSASNWTDTASSSYNYITLGTPSDFLFGPSVDFSVAMWVKLPAGSLNGDLPFFCSSTNSYGNMGITLAPSYKLGGWSWWLGQTDSSGAGLYGANNSINNGDWHSLVYTFTRTGNGVTYLDGTQVNATSIAGLGSIDNVGPFNIGQDPTGTYSESGSFAIDDMGIWRRALTDIEAKSIYIVGQNYAKSFDVPGTVTLSLIPLAGGNYGISWGSGTLKQATNLLGPWTTVSGATIPFYQFTPTKTNNVFYKVAP